MLFIITQQVQLSLSIQAMQSQQACIISQHLASPLVQVRTQPLSVISHLHMPIVRLQQQTIMPFIIMQQLHMLPANMVKRFCIMLQAMASSHEQVIFMPPVHFSILIVQRGAIIQFVVEGIDPVVPIGVAMPVAPMPVMLARSIIIVAMRRTPSFLVSRRPCTGSSRVVCDTFLKKGYPSTTLPVHPLFDGKSFAQTTSLS